MSTVPTLLVLWLFCCPLILVAILMQWYQNKLGRKLLRGNGYVTVVLGLGFLVFGTVQITTHVKAPVETPASQPEDSSPVVDSTATQPVSQAVPGSENQGDSFNRTLVRPRSKGF